MRLEIHIKQTQQQDITGNNIYFQGNNVNSLTPVIGVLPFARQWRNFGTFIDVTGDCSDLYKLKMSWSAEFDNEGFIAPGTFNATKAASATLTFEAETYRLLKSWLITDVSNQLNSVDVEIWHYDNTNKFCGVFRNWVIKATDIAWCEDGLCTFDTVLKQKEELYNCIRSTNIADNWQQWFQEEPGNGKKHPRFSYCNERRPNASLLIEWFLMSTLVFLIKTVIIPTFLFLNTIFLAINGIIRTINAIISFINAIGGNLNYVKLIDYLDIKELNENIGNFFGESAGCGREHPAPLIRDYISNVCDKCGVKVDYLSAPIFFAENITIETSSRGIVTELNPHYRACYLNTPSRKGVRRFLNLSVFGYSEPDTSTYYIFDNRPIMPLDIFLDSIKSLYNAEWNLRNGTLFIQRKDFYRATTPFVFDFSDNGVDRNRLLEGICFEWNSNKIFAYSQGLYSADGVDTCGDEAKAFMNDVISYGDASKNPVYDGVQDKTTQFGATKFRGDGVDTDYIMDAFQTVVNFNFLTGAFGGATLFTSVQPYLEKYADYALLMRDDKNNLPKILIWDGATYLNARADKYYTGIDTYGPEPTINHSYNSSIYGVTKGWSTVHVPQTFVRGSSLTFGSHPVGLYRVRDLFGAKFYEMKAYLVNYNMYMGIGFQNSMWDWFHWIDDPNKRSVLNMTSTAKIDLCCDALDILGVYGDGSNTKIGNKIALPSGKEGIITSIEVSYDPDEERGQYIEIKANS